MSSVRVHLTNVTGTGAVRLAQSLLPALERSQRVERLELWLPNRGELANYKPVRPSTTTRTLQRRTPNPVSRILECLFPPRPLESGPPILVMGDLPLRSMVRQAVFVQTPHLTSRSNRPIDRIRYGIARQIFRRNSGCASEVIVQTDVMKKMLTSEFPELERRMHIVPQPVPAWLASERGSRTRPVEEIAGRGLRLIYPAAGYPHKNHAFLQRVSEMSYAGWPVDSLAVTLAQTPAPAVPWVHTVGPLPPEGMIELYRRADALLFLSTQESFGFPLVEAMYVGIPIVCPDLPYARTLCGEQAIYFDPTAINSLHTAVQQLKKRLEAGWWPDWRRSIAAFPPDWQQVADTLLDITIGH